MAKGKSKASGLGDDIDRLMAGINKKHGDMAIRSMKDRDLNVEVVPTGILSLDDILGGGIPKGRIIEIYGPESSGKTTLTLHAAAAFQRILPNDPVAFIDAEHALDPVYAEAIGVDMEKLLLAQPDNGEQALEIVDDLVRSGKIGLIIVDSVAALTPKAELEGEMGASHVGLQARLMSQALRKLTASANRSNTTIIFINQIRMKIGVMFGNPETTTGGNALKFYASMRLDVRRKGQTKEGEDVIGVGCKVKVVKNKIAPPFKVAELDMSFGKGIDKYADLMSILEKKNLAGKSGSWYNVAGEKIQGRNAAIEMLSSDEVFYEKALGLLERAT